MPTDRAEIGRTARQDSVAAALDRLEADILPWGSRTAARRLVTRHKAVFFAEKDTAARWIDYEAAVTGALQLIPDGPACDALASDYESGVTQL